MTPGYDAAVSSDNDDAALDTAAAPVSRPDFDALGETKLEGDTPRASLERQALKGPDRESVRDIVELVTQVTAAERQTEALADAADKVAAGGAPLLAHFSRSALR